MEQRDMEQNMEEELLEQHIERQDMANITTEEEKIQQLSDFLKEMSTDKTMLTQFAQQKDFSFENIITSTPKSELRKDTRYTCLASKANSTKFQAICIGKRTLDDITTFNIDSAKIKCEDNVTLLGISIVFMLRFDDHVSQICKRASKQLAVLKHIGRFLTKQGKMTIYNSFIVSNFNYCPLVWHFCSTSSTNEL